jgi:hypothetical protein
MAGCCEYGDEPSGCIKGGGYFDQLSVMLSRTVHSKI